MLRHPEFDLDKSHLMSIDSLVSISDQKVDYTADETLGNSHGSKPAFRHGSQDRLAQALSAQLSEVVSIRETSITRLV